MKSTPHGEGRPFARAGDHGDEPAYPRHVGGADVAAGTDEPYGHGDACFALVTAAPVVPVTFFGTRPLGGGAKAVPGRDERIDIVYREPWTVAPVDWPRTREHVDRTAALLRQHRRGELHRARALTGRELPGPLPVTESDKTPRAGS